MPCTFVTCNNVPVIRLRQTMLSACLL